MIDIAITNSGDLDARQPEDTHRLKLQWLCRADASIRIRFKTGINVNGEYEPAGTAPLKIDFMTTSPEPFLECHALTENQELRQHLLVALRTEIGALKSSPLFGSAVQATRHKDITDDNVIQELQDTVLATVSDYLDNPNVVVRKRNLETGAFYCQNLDVLIYNGNTEVYGFSLEA